MRKMAVVFAAAAAVLCVGSLTWNAAAQTTRGAEAISKAITNYSLVEKAACGPYWGPYCPPWHVRVCGWRHGWRHCWCARCG